MPQSKSLMTNNEPMIHQALARALRPKSFSEMLGQEPVLKTLTNALTTQRLHHAYLFTGSRGVGKTSLARIFAKCLNCETGITPTPCNQCETCQNIDAGCFLDLQEIDAASRTKVEDTRDLLENVQYAPTQGRFKIYLIDEVHMLSTHSFNALLKTLEEPPAHVKFLLATTDPQKLPVTVLSRCLHFNLKNLPTVTIRDYLAKILTDQKIAFENPAITLIAEAGKGSVRDALSLLDQSIAFCQSDLTVDKIRELLGVVDATELHAILRALAEKNGDALYQAIQILHESGIDYTEAIDTLLHTLHQLALIQQWEKATKNTLADYDALLILAKSFSKEDIQLYYQIALHGKRDLPFAPTPALGFEMTLLRMLAFAPETETVAPQATVKIASPKPAPIPQTQQQKAPERQASHIPTSQWNDVVSRLALTGPTLALAKQCSFDKQEGDRIFLMLDPTHAPLVNEKSKERLTQALCDFYAKPIKIEIALAKSTIATPAHYEQKKQIEHQEKAKSSIDNDPAVKQLLAAFDGNVNPHTVKSKVSES